MLTQPQRDEMRSCLTKRLYFNKYEAQEEVIRAFDTDDVDIGEPYPCRYCPWWHTGKYHQRRIRYDRGLLKRATLLV